MLEMECSLESTQYRRPLERSRIQDGGGGDKEWSHVMRGAVLGAWARCSPQEGDPQGPSRDAPRKAVQTLPPSPPPCVSLNRMQVCGGMGAEFQVIKSQGGPWPFPLFQTVPDPTGPLCSQHTQGDAIGPLDVLRHQRVNVHAIQAPLLDLSGGSPVCPIHEAGGTAGRTDRRTSEREALPTQKSCLPLKQPGQDSQLVLGRPWMGSFCFPGLAALKAHTW